MCGTYLPDDYDSWKLSYPPAWDDDGGWDDEDDEPDYGDW